jgi:hypothetical protein
MSIDYAKLEADLRGAMEATLAKTLEGDDADSATNRNGTVLYLRDASKKEVLQAAERAGVLVFKADEPFAYIAKPPGIGHGHHRTQRARAMSAFLADRGWDATTWFQID